MVLGSGEEMSVSNPVFFPTGVKISEVWEPVVKATIVVPNDYLGVVLQLCHGRRGELLDQVNARYVPACSCARQPADAADAVLTLTHRSDYHSATFTEPGYSARHDQMQK